MTPEERADAVQQIDEIIDDCFSFEAATRGPLEARMTPEERELRGGTIATERGVIIAQYRHIDISGTVDEASGTVTSDADGGL